MKSGGKDFLSDEVAGVEELVGLYVQALRAMIDALPTDLALGEPEMGSRQEIMLLLAKAQVAWLTSGLRYWKHIAEIVGKKGLGLVELAAQAKAAEGDREARKKSRTVQQLVLIDKARACLREVGEISLSEAEALRRELMKIEEELRATQDRGPGPKGKRQHRAKN